jgi:polyketide cyclase/dehydrase/lipid transport protein
MWFDSIGEPPAVLSHNLQPSKGESFPMKNETIGCNIIALFRSAAVCAVTLGLGPGPVCAASLTRTIEVKGAPSAVWSVIGSFCAIKNWLPPVGMCIEDGKSPPTRTLVTKDGKASFVEKQVARNDQEHSYSYAFLSSPLPVTDYKSTIKVTAKDDSVSVVTWSGTYTPDSGKEKDAMEALNGVYESGLAAIQAKFK